MLTVRPDVLHYKSRNNQEKETIMTDEQNTLLIEVRQRGDCGILRKELDSSEISVMTSLVKLDLVRKGTSDDKQASVCFFII